MNQNYQAYNCFISSPSDVATERRLAIEAIHRINATCIDVLRFSLNVKAWENQPPQTPHLPEETIQDDINREVENAHFFVLILYRRYGSREPGQTKSNTEREAEVILERLRKRPNTKVLAYFRNLPKNTDIGPQEREVRSFRDRLAAHSVRYKMYQDPKSFQEMLTHDLYEIVLKMRISSYKQDCLRRFWQLGISDRDHSPRAAILFPPVNRHFSDPNNDNDFWLKRLEPSLYFEDHKALEKLRKVLGLIGFRDYKVHAYTHIPDDLQFLNRVWLCMPRSEASKKSLASHTKQARFSFTNRTDKRCSMINWKTRKGGTIAVRSPLGKYLAEQRQSMDVFRDWHGQLSQIVAKDFAVLARLANRADSGDPDSMLQDYYIAGIRGLGTWGAAWFIDRNYSQLKGYEDNKDIQLLLEVTYHNGRIVEVQNVSGKKKKYFDDQNSLARIRHLIKTMPVG